MKKYIYSIILPIIVLFVFWVGGVNFDERGPLQSYIAFNSILVGIFGYIFGSLYDKE